MMTLRKLNRFALAFLLLVCVMNNAQAQSEQPILTENFDGAFTNDASPECAGDLCLVPSGWGVWYTRRAQTDQPGVNFQPKFAQTKEGSRVKAGGALRYFTENATHTGGVLRIVKDVSLGARIKLVANGQAWSTNDDSPISARPSRDIKLKIGIDPLGGEAGRASPFSSQIVWSAEQSPTDGYKEFVVETEAKANSVILYLYSTMKDSVRHNEVFWDDVSLVYVAPPATPTTEGAQPATPTPEVSLTPELTPTPESVGDVKVTVKSGDTMSSIALANGIPVAELLRLNPNVNPSLLQVGQELIIKKGAVQPTVEATATPDATLQQSADPTSNLPPTPTQGFACVLAFFDDDGNGKRDEAGEDFVPQILFSLSKDGTPLGNYISDGVNEPHCFPAVQNGDYIVSADIQPSYVTTTPKDDTLRVDGGQAFFSLGIRRIDDGPKNVSVTPTPTPSTSLLAGSNLLGILSIIGGVLMIVGLVGFLLSSILRRRRL